MSGEETVVSYHDAFFGFMIDHLWQTTLFGVLTLAAILVLKRAPARIRYILWTAASLKFLIPSAALVWIAFQIGINLPSFFMNMAWATGDPIGFLTRQNDFFYVTQTINGSELHVQNSAFWVLSTIWISGSAVLFSIWIQRQIAFRRKLKDANILQSGREINLLSKVQERMGITRKVQLLVSSQLSEVGVWGVFHPMILLPVEIPEHLSDSELEAIFLHELIHVSRWDNLISNVQMTICCLFWFHPLVWLVDRMLLSERERVCDDRVLQLGSASKTYASSLVKVLRFGLGMRIAGASCAGGSNLKQRIENIVAGQSNQRVSIVQRVLLATVLLVLVIFTIAAVKVDRCEMDLLKKKMALTQSNCPDA
jgi:beta-lactamase regulating signal transducer with metallopeptidase domain